MGNAAPFDWIELLALGAAAGCTGQLLRLIVGLKKRNDAGIPPSEPFLASRVLLSLLVGAVTGALAAVVAIGHPGPVDQNSVLALAAAGYAGTDFIEGWIPQATRPLAGGRG